MEATMFVSIGTAARILAVHPQTLRRWEREGELEPVFRTPGGHRRYRLADLRKLLGDLPEGGNQRPVAYARVSSWDQKDDLERQKERLKDWCEQNLRGAVVLSDLGSGINFRKKGLVKLIRMILCGQVSDLVLTHKDRLLRFGNELLMLIAEHFGVRVHVIEEEKERNAEQVFAEDVLCLLTVFSARLYGKRAHENRKRRMEAS